MFSNLFKRFNANGLGRWTKFLSTYSTRFSYREHLVVDLTAKDLLDQTVSLYGWLQHRRMNSFGVLRDHSGSIQFVLPASLKDERRLFKQTPVESCLHIRGILRRRPDKDVNAEQQLGHLEVRSTGEENGKGGGHTRLSD